MSISSQIIIRSKQYENKLPFKWDFKTYNILKNLNLIKYLANFVNTAYCNKFFCETFINQLNYPKSKFLVKNITLKVGTKQNKLFISKSFNIFTNFTLSSPQLPIKTHHSNKMFLLRPSKYNSNFVLSIVKLWGRYQMSLNLIYNIYFYNIKSLFFGSSFLKNEVSAFNWSTIYTIKYPTRLNQLLLANIPNKRNIFLTKIIKLLNINNISHIFISDIILHKNILYMLQNSSIFTSGLTPLTFNANSVDLSIPITTDNVFIQSFFLQTFLYLRKSSENTKYGQFKQLWYRL